MNPLFTPIVAGTLVFFFAGIWIARKARTKIQARSLVVIFLVAATPAFLFAAYYIGFLGEAGWFYTFRSWPNSECCACGAGLLAGLFQFKRKQSPRISKHLSAGFIPFILLLCVSAPYLKQIFLRPDWKGFGDRWSEGVCLQSSESSCGPASAATLLKLAGRSATEKEIAQESFTSRRGTENWYLIRTLRHHGLEVHYSIGQPDKIKFSLPSIAGVRLGGKNGTGHFIALIGKSGNRYVVGDPLNGREELDQAQLRDRYYFTGFSIAAESN